MAAWVRFSASGLLLIAFAACGGGDDAGGGQKASPDGGSGSGGTTGGSGGTGGAGGSTGGSAGASGSGGSACNDECSQSSCDGLTFKQCAELDSDTCLDLAPAAVCQSSNACLVGACDPSAGCSSTPVTCTQPPASSCVAPDTLLVYDTTGSCANGTCEYTSHEVACPNCPACDACANVTCNTPPSACHQAIGTCSNGSCSYAYDDGKVCDDGDACTDNDQCGTGVCAGAPKLCNAPPSACHQSLGTCNGGTCSYGFADGKSCNDQNVCTSGDQCSAGACAGAPLSCNTPPQPTCLNTKTLRTYSLPGTCATPTGCSYATSDTTCPYACVSGQCVACTDEIVTADATTSGLSTSIEVDVNSAVHISYRTNPGNVLKYAFRPLIASSFTATVLDSSSVVTNTSLGLDANNNRHIAYDDSIQDALVHIFRSSTGGSWTKTVVDSTNHVLEAGGIALDSSNGVHVSYKASPGVNQRLMYAYRPASGAWTTSNVDVLNPGSGSSLAAGPSGSVHIVSYGAYNPGLRYAHRASTGSAWVLSTVDPLGASSGGTYDTSIALAPSGSLHVAYFDSLNADLEYAERSPAGTWSLTTIDTGTVNGQMSLVLDASAGVHVAYSAGGTLKYAYRPAAGAWTTLTVDATIVTGHPSIDVEPGAAHFSYYDGTNFALKYARRCL